VPGFPHTYSTKFASAPQLPLAELHSEAMFAGTVPDPAAAEDEPAAAAEAEEGAAAGELAVPPLPDEELLLQAARADTATQATAPTSHRRRLIEDFISRISLVVPRHRWDGPGLRTTPQRAPTQPSWILLGVVRDWWLLRTPAPLAQQRTFVRCAEELS
jgi:hypothetical protein